jgi:predicted phosphate transport protein (TIGR00153 family)
MGVAAPGIDTAARMASGEASDQRWGMRFLLPRDDTFFVLFTRSAETMVAAAEALVTLFTDGPVTAERFAPLDDIEHQGDAITHEVIGRLTRTFITPLDRDDIHRLIHVLDDVIDAAEAAGELAMLCKVIAVQPPARELARVLVDITREVASLVPHLRTGNAGREHFVHVHELENEGDRLWSQAVAGLFDGRLDPLEVLKWKEIYETIEEAIDACEDAAQIIEEIVYKQA